MQSFGLDFNEEIEKQNEGFGIKSYLGHSPTLLNASLNTNFIFEILNFDVNKIDEINNISTRTKLKDKIQQIEKLGGKFQYVGAERDIMEYNLKITDSLMPQIVGEVLLQFYKNRISSIPKITRTIHESGELNRQINYGDLQSLELKIKKLLVDILLGFFAGKKWDGEYESNGTIVLKKTAFILLIQKL